MDEIECIKCIYNINNECKIGGWTIPKIGCSDGKEKPLTNADRIRSMTDEELASILTDDFCELLCSAPVSCNGDCEAKMLEWLKQEVTDEHP